jgi:hypothetical protein
MLDYMSIVTLKKKSRHNRRFAPISGRAEDGFSLNGGHRNIGAVGQFRLISNTTRTPFRGTAPMGHGGNGGAYYDKPLNSGSCCTNDNHIIKKSSKNTAGMIDTKYAWTKGTYPNYWVKEDDNSYNLTRDQATYIRNLTQQNGNCNVDYEPTDNFIYSCSGNRNACSYYIGTKKYIRKPYAKQLNQSPISQGQYILTGGAFKKECLPTPANKQPFPMKLNHNNYTTHHVLGNGTTSSSTATGASQINYMRWQDAWSADGTGILPADWTP